MLGRAINIKANYIIDIKARTVIIRYYMSRTCKGSSRIEHLQEEPFIEKTKLRREGEARG